MDRNSTRILSAIAALGLAAALAGCKAAADVKSGANADGKSGGTVEMTMNYPIVLGNEDIAEHFGGLLGYPSSYLISRDGRVVKRIIGLVSRDEIAHEIESQLSVSSDSATSAASQSASSTSPNEPDVTFQELQGGALPLASLKGKVVLVNFWATWCDPCRIEIPWLIGFQQQYASQGFTIIGVAMDEEGRSVVEPFVEKTKFEVDKNAVAR
ncbi:MAG TPA: TlpA family protein disulfide reductase [Candidatus Acidoferrales bacterium]|nr:TlpA family protein disulfide reductase [Candidatus Acidoferrales bacterium]